MTDVSTPLIVAVGVIVGPLLLAYLTSRQRRTEKQEDYARQDAVAAQAAEAARLLEERQNATAEKTAGVARLLLAANERVAKQTAAATDVVNGKLAQIHELVNSSLTAQIEEAYGALVQQLVLMREIIRLNTEAGRDASPVALNAVTLIEARIAEMHTTLIDRAKATEIAHAELTNPST